MYLRHKDIQEEKQEETPMLFGDDKNEHCKSLLMM